jgi:GH24 family phage-related lysozyme (muramidase)
VKGKSGLIVVTGAAVAAWLVAFTPTQEGLRLVCYRDPVGIATKCHGEMM